MKRAPLLGEYLRVQGKCPACGASSLFLAAGGYVTCSRLECPAPDAPSDLLDQVSAEVYNIVRSHEASA